MLMPSSLAIQSELITGGTFTAVAGDYHLHVADSTLKDGKSSDLILASTLY